MSLDLKGVWALSPLACMGCIVAGLSNSAFRLVGPVYAEGIGLSITEIAIFISLGVIGGVVLQYPLGSLSDRWDRRWVLLITSAASMVLAPRHRLPCRRGPHGQFRADLPLLRPSPCRSIRWPLPTPTTFAGKGGYVKVAAALMFFYSIGAIVGPLVSSFLMERYGLHALFHYSAAVYALFVAGTIWRMAVRSAPPRAERGRFAALLRTSPIFGETRLSRRYAPQTSGGRARIRLTRPRPCLNWNGIREAKRSERSMHLKITRQGRVWNAVVARLEESDFVTVDTEFKSAETILPFRWPILCRDPNGKQRHRDGRPHWRKRAVILAALL